MKFISYTNDGRVAIQHAALILSKLDEADTLELHTMDNAIILLKKDMTRAETRDVLQGMVRLARSMTLDALCNSDAEDKTPLVDESFDHDSGSPRGIWGCRASGQGSAHPDRRRCRGHYRGYG